MKFSKDMNEFKRESTVVYVSAALAQFAFAWAMVSLNVGRLDTELLIFNPNLEHYKYDDHQYWLHFIGVVAYVPVVSYLSYRGLNVQKIFFPRKAGGGNVALMLAVGVLMSFYIFYGFEGGAGKMTLAMQQSLVGIYLFSQCLLMGATAPFIWGLMWFKWKAGERHGKSNEHSG